MGRPKQLLPFRGVSLLRQAATQALATGFGPVVVVLGAQAETCGAEIRDLPVVPKINASWQEGMGGSLRAGMEQLTETAPGAKAVLVMLPDQPLIPLDAYRRLAELWQPPRWLIAAALYGGSKGVPAIFDRALFPELKRLAGPEGAKKVIARHAGESADLELPEALEDVDSPGDYQRIIAIKSFNG